MDHPDWILELKLDGFRALAYVENGEGRLMSRSGNTFASFRDLAAEIAADFRGINGILDGEIASLDERGHPQFGEDLRREPMFYRKRSLRRVVPRRNRSRLRYLDHIEDSGYDLFRLACETAATAKCDEKIRHRNSKRLLAETS